MIYLDTHVVVWLASERSRFSEPALNLIKNTETLYVSPMVELELQYLYEIGRLKLQSTPILEYLQRALSITRCHKSFIDVVHAAKAMHWTRDPFDRLITAQCSLSSSTLITADDVIQEHYPHTVW